MSHAEQPSYNFERLPRYSLACCVNVDGLRLRLKKLSESFKIEPICNSHPEFTKDNLSIPELFSLKINLLFPAIDIDSRSELIWTGLV